MKNTKPIVSQTLEYGLPHKSSNVLKRIFSFQHLNHKEYNTFNTTKSNAYPVQQTFLNRIRCYRPTHRQKLTTHVITALLHMPHKSEIKIDINEPAHETRVLIT